MDGCPALFEDRHRAVQQRRNGGRQMQDQDISVPVIISRDAARDNGLKHFFTGIPCKRGHRSIRFVSTTQCRECQNMHSIIWRQANPEKAKAMSLRNYHNRKEVQDARSRQWHSDNPNPEQNRARVKAWRKKYPEKRRKQSSIRYQKHKEVLIAKGNAWKKLHPEVASATARRRKAQKLGADGSHTVEDVLRIWDAQGHKCAVPNCTHPIASRGKNIYEVDHIMPLHRGGSDGPRNIQCLCRYHNRSKAYRDPYEWAQTLALAQGLLFLK